MLPYPQLSVAPPTDRRGALLPSLAGLRFFAAVAVFLVHVCLLVPFADQRVGGVALFVLEPLGFGAVSFFFMLSGFVLTWTSRPTETTRSYLRRRGIRVMPNHLLVLTVVVLLTVPTGREPGVPQVLAQAFLVQAWVPSIDYIDVLNTATWTTSAEISFYLMFPLLLPLVQRIRPWRLWAWTVAAFVPALVVPFVVRAMVPSSGLTHSLSSFSLLPFLDALNSPDHVVEAWGGASYLQVWFVYHFPLTRLFEFVIGMLLARIVMTDRWFGLRPRAAVLLMILAAAAAIFVPFLFRVNSLTVMPLALLLGSLAARDVSGGPTSWLGSRRMVWLGNLTFAFYLVHGPVLNFGRTALGTVDTGDGPESRTWGTLATLALVALALGLSLLLAWLLFRHVESRAMRRWGGRPLVPTAAVQSGDIELRRYDGSAAIPNDG